MKNIVVTGLLLLALPAMGQEPQWIEQMRDPSVNFYTVQQNFEQYWAERDVEKGKGWKQFKRWEAFMEPRVYPEGTRPDPGVLMEQYQQAHQQNQGSGELGQWRPLGPYDGPALGGIGRVNRVRFHPNNHQIVFALTPSGGLWKSTDGGANWTTNTDLLPNLGASDLAIDPNNPNVMYLVTGDRDGADTYSYGLLKSTDGGNTWQPSGLNFSVQMQIRAHDVHVSPSNSNVVIVVTRSGIYRSTDAGDNWLRVKSGSFNGLEQKPGNPNVLYTSTIGGSNNVLYRSTDMGVSWQQMNSPAFPSGNARRIELAVTPDDSNYVYAVIGASNNGFEGLYRSTDGGNTWTQRANSPNLLGWSTNGSDNGGQAWYDLAIAVNPQNKNEVFVGGVNIWRSTNGGSNWSQAAHWYGGGGAPFVHADIHHLTYQPVTNYLYAGTDGGIYRDMPNQTSWDALNDGMNITQYYRIGASVTDTSLVLGGTQDNGTHRLRNSNWARVRGGDGMECAVNTRHSNVMYSSIYYGNIRKSTNGGQNFNATFNLPPSGSGNWVTPYLLDPLHPDTIYAGFSRVWRSYNGGVSFTAVSGNSMTGGQNIDQMAIAPLQTNILYISEGSGLWKTTDRGANWSNLSGNVPGGSAISYIAVDYHNPDHVIITRSGYNSSQKVYESYDGGQSFSNISSGLPNLPVNCVTIENNDEHSIYIGTDVGVYYRDSINTEWQSYNGNLPNVIVNELEINYTNRKLRAATYGRGLWESPLYSDLVPPVARAEFPKYLCIGDTADLLNVSDYAPESFRWVIEPANYSFTGADSDSTENPQVVFHQKGFYNIALIIENSLGEDSVYYPGAIAVGGLPLPYESDLTRSNDRDRWEYQEDSLGWSLQTTGGELAFRAGFHNNPQSGQTYELISPALDFTQHDSAWFKVEHAYSGRSGNMDDSLFIYISDACGEQWSLLVALGENGMENFRTTAQRDSTFEPRISDWCGSGMAKCPEMDLSPWAGKDGVRLKFVARNAGGNHLYLRHLEVRGRPTTAPTAAFDAQREVCALDTIDFMDQTYGSPDTWNWYFSGPQNLTSTDRNPQLSFTQPGLYSVSLSVTNPQGADSLHQVSFITVKPADSTSLQWASQPDTLCPGTDLKVNINATNAGNAPQYVWYKNAQPVGTTNSPEYTFPGLQDGDELVVSLRSSLECAFPANIYSDTLTIVTYPAISPQISAPSILCTTDSAVTLAATPPGGVFSGKAISGNNFDPATAGQGSHEITYTYTDANSCTFEAKAYIGVTNPTLVSVSGNVDACLDGPAVSLNVGSPNGGKYSGPGVYGSSFYPDSVPGLGTYQVTYSFTSNFCGTSVDSFVVVVNPLPARPQIALRVAATNYLECLTSANAYQWFDTTGAVSGATNKTFTPQQSGNYWVRITDGKGCQAMSDSLAFNIGLEELPWAVDFELFPNPTRGEVSLKLDLPQRETVQLKMVNSVGQHILQRQWEGARQYRERLDLGHLAPGVYILTLEGQSGQMQRMLIVE